MGVSHSMNKGQVDEVLTEFESTTSAIKGIEHKISRVQGYVKTAKEQRETMSRQAEDATGLIDSMTASMNTKTEDLIEYFTDTLDFFADLMESLETTIADLQLMNAPRELQRELGPLLVPAVVLVLIITVSNCFFGFLLAGDEEAAGKITLDMLFGGAGDESEITGSGINILRLFAVVHVVLIGIAVFYLVFEGCRRQFISRRRRRDMRVALEKQVRAEAHMEAREMSSDEEDIGDDTDFDHEIEEEVLEDEERNSGDEDPAEMDELRPGPEVGRQKSSGLRVNKQLSGVAGDSSPLSEGGFSARELELLDVTSRSRASDDVDELSPGSQSPGKATSSRQDSDDLFSSGADEPRTKKAITPPRALQPLHLPIQDHTRYDQVLAYDFRGPPMEEATNESSDNGPPHSPGSTPSQRPSPGMTAAPRRHPSFRKNSEFSDDDKSGRAAAKNRHRKMRHSTASSNSKELSPTRRLSMSRVPKIQISSVLRKMQQKAVQVTKEGHPRPTREAMAPHDEDMQEERRRPEPRCAPPPSAISANTSPVSGFSPLKARLGEIGDKVDRRLHEIQSRSARKHDKGTGADKGAGARM